MSGHAHRVTLLLSLLGLPYRRVDVDLRGGEHKQQPFLALNAFGQVPVLEDEGAVIADSNAILVYLGATRARPAGCPRMRWAPPPCSAGSRWLPDSWPRDRTRRGWPRCSACPIPARRRRTHALLAVMDAELGRRDWLAGEAATIADVACYAYVALAPEGNVSLQDYPRVRAGWRGSRRCRASCPWSFPTLACGPPERARLRQ